MRKLKFRAERVDNGKQVYGDLNQNPVHYECQIIENGVIHHNVNPETVGQFTGLKDKNGVEIYEGDHVILSYEDGRYGQGEIKWHKGGFQINDMILQDVYYGKLTIEIVMDTQRSVNNK